MEYVDVRSGVLLKDGAVAGPVMGAGPQPQAPVQAPPPQAATGTDQWVAPQHGHATVEKLPPIPVYMDDDEKFVDFRKPGFWSYTPTIFSFSFGLVLFLLFTAGGGFGGFLLGIMILGGLMLFVRYRLWAKTGYWFTNHKIVLHDGARTRLVPYDEIALSSLAFEGQDCMFQTVYHQEIVLKGIVDMDQVVAFISKKVKEARKGQAVTNGKHAVAPSGR